MECDVAVGVGQAVLDRVLGAIYARKPTLFRGSATKTVLGAPLTATYQATQAPQVDLSPGDQATRALGAAIGAALGPERAAEVPPLLAALPGQALLTVRFPAISLQVTGEGLSLPLTIGVDVHAQVLCAGTTLSLRAVTATSPPQSDPSAQAMVQLVVLPAFLALAGRILESVAIPPIGVPGLTLGVGQAVVTPDHVMLLANLPGRGAPGAVPSARAGQEFFALLGPVPLRALVTSAVRDKTRGLSEKTSGSVGPIDWDCNFGIDVQDPSTAVHGTQLVVRCPASGGATGSAGKTVGWGRFSHHFGASIGFSLEAAPVCTLDLSVQDGRLRAQTASVDELSVSVRTQGDLGVLGDALSPMTSFLTGRVGNALKGFFQGIDVDSFDVPSYSVSLDDVRLALTPGHLWVSPFEDGISVLGDVQVG